MSRQPTLLLFWILFNVFALSLLVADLKLFHRKSRIMRPAEALAWSAVWIALALAFAAAIYFFVVMPVNALVARMNRGEKPPDPTTKKCAECLSDIPIEARRCAHCTQPVMGRAA